VISCIAIDLWSVSHGYGLWTCQQCAK